MYAFYCWLLASKQQRFLRWIFRHTLLLMRRLDKKSDRLEQLERKRNRVPCRQSPPRHTCVFCENSAWPELTYRKEGTHVRNRKPGKSNAGPLKPEALS